MTGYPIVFDTWTEINSWEGKFREQVAPGEQAFHFPPRATYATVNPPKYTSQNSTTGHVDCGGSYARITSPPETAPRP